MNNNAWQQIDPDDDYITLPPEHDHYGEFQEVYNALVAAQHAVVAFQSALEHYETATEWAEAETSTPDGVISIRRDDGDRGTKS